MIASVLLFAATALAAPTSVASTAAASIVPTDYTWSVVDWTAGDARGAYAWFNISGEAAGSAPAFSASCSLHEHFYWEQIPDIYTKCTVTSENSNRLAVSGKFGPREGGAPKKFAVSIQFTEDKPEYPATYNGTAWADTIYNQVTAPPQSFTIAPSEWWGIA